MRARVLPALAVADFLERTRRPAYLVTLAAAVVLGYLALPPAGSLWVVMNAGGYRGVYNSAWVGAVAALSGTLWLMGAGFYVVRSAIARDQQTGVGQILAATPLRNTGYLAGKFLSNLMVLASMAVVLAVTALALQLVRGESRAVDPGALLLPFAVLTLPVLAMTAAAAVVFETIPVLRGGVGNIAWFFLWMFTVIAGGGAPLGGLGTVAASMRQTMAAQQLRPAGEFSVGFTKVNHPLPTFTWNGLHLTGGFATTRIVLILVAACLAVLPAVWFYRFDPARGRARGVRAGAAVPTVPDSGQALTPVPNAGAGRLVRPARPVAYRPLPRGEAGRRWAFWRLLSGEIRILVQGTSRWWWLVAALVNVAALAVPANLVKPSGASTALLLSAAWIWPVLIWSRLGAQRRENGVETLLGSYPAAYRQLAAEWAAGLALTVAAGAGPLLRIAAAADGPRLAAWIAGALFIPSLALLLGTVSRTHRTFQVLYVILWYAAINQVAAADYMGTVLRNGRPAGPSPLLIAAVSAAMLAATFTIRAARQASR
jgi:ABC-type transport system involved in multi-copper enzyme maturation permease subunit